MGTAAKDVEKVIADLGELPRGLTVELIGLSKVLHETLSSLESGLWVAIVVIFLMLAANFQSFKVSLVVLTAAPAVVLGSLLTIQDQKKLRLAVSVPEVYSGYLKVGDELAFKVAALGMEAEGNVEVFSASLQENDTLLMKASEEIRDGAVVE